MSRSVLLARKEAGELFRSARGLGWLLALSALLSVFSLLFVGNTELSLLDNAEAVYLMMATISALGSLLAVVLGSDSIAGEKERGSLVPLLLAPLSTQEVVLGKIGGLVAGWMVTYLIALPYLWAVGSSGQNLVQAIVYLGLLGTPVVLGFGFYAMGLSARFGTVRAALGTSLISLALLASPLLIGPRLRQNPIGKLFDAINPFSAAVNAFDSAVIDSQPFSAQLGQLATGLTWVALTAWFAASSVWKVEI
jgi:ABC-type Na+ efflux pump permease subunit